MTTRGWRPSRAIMVSLALFSAPVGAAELDDPSGLVAAFDETCRRGFPDLETITKTALANGWIERSIRPVVGGAAFQNAAAPQVLKKGALTLFLSTPNAIGMKLGCQIATSAGFDVPLANLADATSRTLRMDEPELSRTGGSELAQWRPQTPVLIQASVHRRPRSASLQMRIEP